jgi:iron complex outermembrane receptor protein
LAGIAAIGGLQTGLQAQTDEAASDGDVYVLSPFLVEEETRGYRAYNTISATRINTAIRDLPLSIEVITEDFMTDIGAFDIQSALRFTSGVTPSGDAGSRIRGFSSNWSQRNGFRRFDIGDTANVERVEVIKGPSGVLYGQTRPGGVINYITKRPKLGRNFGEIRLVAGSDAFYRGQFDANVAVGEDMAFRLIAAKTETDTAIINGGREVTFWSPALVYQVTPNTQITLEAEFLVRNQVPTVGRLSNIGGHFRDNFGDGSPAYVDELFPFISFDERFADPRENQRNEVNTYILTLDHQFTEGLSARLVGYKMDRLDREISTARRGWNTSISALRDANGDFLLDGNGVRIPHIRRMWADDSSANDWQAVQGDLVYTFDTGSINHRFLAGFYWAEDDHNRTLYEDRDFILIPDPANPGATPDGYRLVNRPGTTTPYGFLSNPQYHFSPLADLSDLSINNPNNAMPSWQFPWLEYNDIIGSTAYYINYIGKAFQDKLVIMAGLRYEEADKTRYNFGAVGAEDPWTDDHVAPQVGLIYNFRPEIGVYAVYAESFDPQNGQSDSFGVQFDPLVGENLEFGLKGELNDGKYSYSLAYFNVDETNRIFNDPNAINAGGGFGDNVAAGLANSEGFDFNFTANPTANWSTVISISHISLEQKQPTVVKLDNFEGSGLSWSIWTNYAFIDGALEGFSIGGGAIYTDEWNGFGGRTPGDYILVDARMGYQFMIGQKQASLSINVKNLGDRRHQGENTGWLAPRQVYLTGAIAF